MRAFVGLIAGVITGIVISPGTDQNVAGGTIIIIGIVFYIISYGVAKNIAKNIPQTMRRKLVTNGIFPFIFMLLMFMIIVYTGLHQKSQVKILDAIEYKHTLLWNYRTPGIPDELFERTEQVPITKEDVRALVLSKLRLKEEFLQ